MIILLLDLLLLGLNVCVIFFSVFAGCLILFVRTDLLSALPTLTVVFGTCWSKDGILKFEHTQKFWLAENTKIPKISLGIPERAVLYPSMNDCWSNDYILLIKWYSEKNVKL